MRKSILIAILLLAMLFMVGCAEESGQESLQEDYPEVTPEVVYESEYAQYDYNNVYGDDVFYAVYEYSDDYNYENELTAYYYVYYVYYYDTYILLEYALVTRVIDGDTIELEGGYRVRFIGVDAPEVGEPGAVEATEFVRYRVEGQTVWLEPDGDDKDRFGRLRRYVWLTEPADTTCETTIRTYMLNALLLEYGLASAMILGTPHVADLFLYLDNFVPPATQIEQPTQAAMMFIGNRNSQIFHRTTCSSLPAAHNRMYFESRQDAVDAGHRPCRRCNP